MTERPSGRTYLALFGISFLILFLELACIRWFGSYVVFLTYFTNVILLASFVGMSVGCLAASRRINFINWMPLLLLIAIGSALGLLAIHRLDLGVAVDVGHQAAPERVYFGTGFTHSNPDQVKIPIQVIAGYFFILVVLVFVGLGQVLGRCLEKIPNRILAYSTNIVGSLVGILAFGAVSFLWLSPFWWFLIALGGCWFFLSGTTKKVRWVNSALLVTIILVTGLDSWGVLFQLSDKYATENRETLWSPYYRVMYNPTLQRIGVNNIGHQQMLDRNHYSLPYGLPYLLNKEIGGKPIEDVLIIGAGSGNDVSVALAFGVTHIDAVEIDPIMQHLGAKYHPSKPYDDPRVTVHLNDGRNFLKQTEKKYDLVIYALVDSLILHSGYASIRLENFLFTQQAFNEVRSRLKPGGRFVLYNYYRQGWVIERLSRMAKKTFGTDPIVMSFPTKKEIEPGAMEGAYTMIVTGHNERVSEAFAAGGPFFAPRKRFLEPHRVIGFGVEPIQDDDRDYWEAVAPAKVVASEAGSLLPSDSWPMLYLQKKRIPALNLWGMGIIGGLALLVLFLFAPRGGRKGRFNWTLFFLGAGFMLLEAKGVVHLALLFGSTWLVNSFVFFAILVMVLLSNLFVLLVKPQRLTGWYLAVVLSLVANVFISLDIFLGQSDLIRIGGSCLMVFLPIFFAGVIFATLFRDSKQPDYDFGSNIAGVVLGGLAENFSLILGFQHLLWIAVGFYLLARLFQRRGVA